MKIQLDWNTIIGFFGGGGLVAFIFREAIKERFGRSNIKWKEKRQLAKEIIAFIDEGQSAGFETRFDGSRFKKASKLISYALLHDPKLSEKINQFQGLWAVYAMMNPERMKISAHQYNDHIKSLTGYRAVLDEKVDEIRKKVVKWLK